MAKLKCIVVTPEETSLEEEVSFVALPLYDGELGVAPGHSPLIGRLTYGELRLKHNAREDRYYVDGGFVQIADDVVSVLTSRVVPAAELDLERAMDQLQDAHLRPGHTEELLEIRERLIRQARAQLHIIRRRGH